jgi:hypothetical protein
MNKSRLEEPAPEQNIKRIAESLCGYAPGDKRAIGRAERELKAKTATVDEGAPDIDDDALPDFPEIVWRGAFADYRDAMAGTTEASDVAHFATLWAAAAVTMGRRVSMTPATWSSLMFIFLSLVRPAIRRQQPSGGS